MRRIDQRIIIVTRKTRQEELNAKFGTKGQAQFYVARSRSRHAGEVAAGAAAREKVSQKALAQAVAQAELLEEAKAIKSLQEVEEVSRGYQEIIRDLRQGLDFDLPVQVVDRAYVPNMVFGKEDIIVAVGQDGLVANVAKYAVNLPIIGVNPDPAQYDGILLPFQWREARGAVQRTLEGRASFREVTLAEAQLNDTQRILAFNDLFIGARSHTSARYVLEVADHSERQSSSGIIVSTGAGSTGWLSSILNMARGVMALRDPTAKRPALPMKWEDRALAYVVREPFVSKTSSANLVAGMLRGEHDLTIESLMGPEGVIFSDGVESDAIPFAEGAIATIRIAKECAKLVVG